jgi:disulfide bond formation protein DsbB
MKAFELKTLTERRQWIGLFAIVICALAWTMEIIGSVYICPYCRVQRTVIGILGFILLLPFAYHWLVKYAAIVLGFFGAVVASNQHFMGWKKISSGEFQFNDNIFIDPFLLSGFALTGIIGMTCLILKLQNEKV